MRRGHLPLVAVLAASVALRLWGIDFGLPHTFARPDEDAVVAIGRGFVGVTLKPAFFDWPSMFMYAVAVAYALYFNIGRFLGSFPRDATFIAATAVNQALLFLIPRVLSATAGVLTVDAVYRIGARLFDRTTALLGAAFLAVAALHVRDSHFGVTDVTATWLLTISFLFTVKYARGGRDRDVLLSSLFAGLAASTKYNAVIVMLPGAWAIASHTAGGSQAAGGKRVRLLCLYVLVAAAAFLLGTPYAALDPKPFLMSLRNVISDLRAGRTAFAGYAWRVHLASSLRYGLGVPMLAAGIGGFALYCWRDRRAGVLFAMTPVAYFAIIGAGQTAFARYIIPTLPFLCIGAAYFTVEAAQAIGRSSRHPHATVALTGLLAALVAAPSAWSAIQSDRLLGRIDNRLLAAQWLHDQFRVGATIYQSGSVYGLVQMQTSDPEGGDRYPQVTFDENSARFYDAKGAATPPPELIVVTECPLAYCSVPATLPPVLARYVLLQTLTAVDPTYSGLVYDRDDAFFVPLAGFGAVTRPGPNLMIYRRRD